MNDYVDWNRETISRIKTLLAHTSTKLYLTLHDDIVYRMPSFFSNIRISEFAHILDLARSATCIFTPSEAERHNLAKHFSEDSELRVVPHSAAHVLEFAPKGVGKAPKGMPTFMHFLGSDPRKNSFRTLSSLLLLAKTGIVFKVNVIGNQPTPDTSLSLLLSEFPRVGILVEYFANISEEDLSLLYQRSDCLIYTSLAEGFGLPIAEASEIGCAVITSNFGSMLEVGKNYPRVQFANPYDTHEIATELITFIKKKDTVFHYNPNSNRTWETCYKEIRTVIEKSD